MLSIVQKFWMVAVTLVKTQTHETWDLQPRVHTFPLIMPQEDFVWGTADVSFLNFDPRGRFLCRIVCALGLTSTIHTLMTDYEWADRMMISRMYATLDSQVATHWQMPACV